MKSIKFLDRKLSLFLAAMLLFPLISYSEAEVDKTREIQGLDVSIELADDDLRIYEERLFVLIDSAFSEYGRLFGGMPKKADGKLYSELKIKLSNGFGGEADPETIDLRVSNKELFGFYNWEMIALHEISHLWSAETFRYADDQEQWFNEGVTEYFTYRLAVKLGIISKESASEYFARPIAYYLSARDIGKISLRGAGSTPKSKQDHYFLVYHGGFVVGLVLDHQIRLRSDGTMSLENLMLELYKENSIQHPYTMESIADSLKKSTSFDFSEFLERYVNGTEIIPVGAYFDVGSLEISQEFELGHLNKQQRVLQEMLSFD